MAANPRQNPMQLTDELDSCRVAVDVDHDPEGRARIDTSKKRRPYLVR